jgi:PIN domain nuclease of toxin-antitoxin system
MDVLIDTQVLIWNFENNPKLSSKTKQIINDINNHIFVSIASFWEITIKVNINKLKIPVSINEMIEKALSLDYSILPISARHLSTLENLPLHHRDPFDRIIISSAISENLPIISVDSNFDKYSIELIW